MKLREGKQLAAITQGYSGRARMKVESSGIFHQSVSGLWLVVAVGSCEGSRLVRDRHIKGWLQ